MPASRTADTALRLIALYVWSLCETLDRRALRLALAIGSRRNNRTALAATVFARFAVGANFMIIARLAFVRRRVLALAVDAVIFGAKFAVVGANNCRADANTIGIALVVFSARVAVSARKCFIDNATCVGNAAFVALFTMCVVGRMNDAIVFITAVVGAIDTVVDIDRIMQARTRSGNTTIFGTSIAVAAVFCRAAANASGAFIVDSARNLVVASGVVIDVCVLALASR